ncbi:jg10237 [Pararge aegeria aegeria]|uniref:Jg10237 protein n=1 Tax=Pararge aegeria aegeria TaxID=348720 RepID=A0A8S4S8L9_9NEOP|nr:jg10237 [Pararge aegeria aegeria]
MYQINKNFVTFASLSKSNIDVADHDDTLRMRRVKAVVYHAGLKFMDTGSCEVLQVVTINPLPAEYRARVFSQNEKGIDGLPRWPSPDWWILVAAMLDSIRWEPITANTIDRKNYSMTIGWVPHRCYFFVVR